MKLRVRGDSIRLRLTRTEVERLAKTGEVHDAVHFDRGGTILTYSIQTRADAEAAWAEFASGTLRVVADRQTIRQWADSEEVALEWNGSVPALLIEKDFVCLQPRRDEESSDLYPNPRLEDAD